MNKEKKDFMNRLSNLDDFSVEEIAEKYPALPKSAKKRILKQCIKKDSFSDEIISDGEGRITISGTERYNRKPWYNFAASAAAFVIAIGGITGVFMLSRNFNGSDISVSEDPPVISSSDNDPKSTSENSAASTNNTPISLSGTNWFKHEYNGPTEKEIEFNKDGSGGYYIIYPDDVITTESTKIPFTYEQNGYDITFCMGPDDTVTAKLSVDGWRAMMTLEWQDGHTESFYDYDIPVTSSNNGASNDGSGQLGTNDNDTPQTSTTIKETPVSNPNGSVSQTQKIFINEIYYVEIAGIHGYMGFEFWQDGRLTKYDFDDYGDIIYATMITADYEIVEDKFYFGDIEKEVGTIINPNDTSSFSVQFSNGLYNFSTERPEFKKLSHVATKPDTLNGTTWSWYGEWDPDYNFTEHIEKRKIEFNSDGVSGIAYIILYPHDLTKMKCTEIPFTYEKKGDEVTFHMENSDYNMLKATLNVHEFKPEELSLAVEYQNGDSAYFALSGSLNN